MMNKAILVMDMPKNCRQCPCSNLGEDIFSDDYCNLIANRKIESLHERPEWCPLKELPQKKKVPNTLYNHSEYFDLGYNACIADILRKQTEC